MLYTGKHFNISFVLLSPLSSPSPLMLAANVKLSKFKTIYQITTLKRKSVYKTTVSGRITIVN